MTDDQRDQICDEIAHALHGAIENINSAMFDDKLDVKLYDLMDSRYGEQAFDRLCAEVVSMFERLAQGAKPLPTVTNSTNS